MSTTANTSSAADTTKNSETEAGASAGESDTVRSHGEYMASVYNRSLRSGDAITTDYEGWPRPLSQAESTPPAKVGHRAAPNETQR